MTYNDDFIRVRLRGTLGVLNITLKQLGLEWPPPPYLNITPANILLKRESMSEITDGERAIMTRVARGAEYVHADIHPSGSA